MQELRSRPSRCFMNAPNRGHEIFHWTTLSSLNRGGHIEAPRVVLP